MKQILNFIPLVFFFVFLVLYDIFAGVEALMITATIAFIISFICYRKIEKVELFSYLMVMIFGGMTLYFHDQSFIKWKVTIINFLFAIVLLVSQVFYKKNLIQKLLGKELALAPSIWNKLNAIWIIFFLLSAIANLFVTYMATDNFFGIFKAFILPGASLGLTILSVVYIYKNLNLSETNQSKVE